MRVQDVAVDNMTGDIIFAGGNTMYRMTTGGKVNSLFSDLMDIQSATVDDINRQV